MKIHNLILFLFLSLFISSSYADTEADDQSSRSLSEERYRSTTNNIKLLSKIYREVDARYVEEIDMDKFMKSGIKGMLETLDPYTVFFEPQQIDDLEMLTTGEYGGVGIEIGLRGKNKELTVIAPIDDTPAAQKGIRSGDVIIAVDGKSTAGFSTSDAADVIRGPAGSNVVLTIRREGYDETMDYTLTRASIRIHDVAYSGIIDNNIGYIRLVRFSGQAGDELRAALQELMLQKPSGLVLDLRSNPGGLLPSAVKVAGEFLGKEDPVVTTRGRSEKSEREFTVMSDPLAADVPLVVLINGGSASASEIVAGAIQDLDRGVVVGTSSFGKGLVQTVVNLPGETMLKITTARYYTPSGRLIQKDEHGEEYGRGRDDDELVEDADLDEPSLKVDSIAVNKQEVTERFYTRNGREVIGGGGIIPDVVVEQPLLSPSIVEMYRRELFFNFVQNWIKEHGQPDTVYIQPEMLDEFEKHLTEIDFKPPVPGTKELEALRKIGEEDSLDTAYFTELDALKEKLTAESRKVDAKLRDNIRQSLENEVASVVGGRAWRIRASLDDDVQLVEALRILKNKQSYTAYLNGPGPQRAHADND